MVVLIVFLLRFEPQALSGFGRLGKRRVPLGALNAKKAIPIIPLSGITSLGIRWQLRVFLVALMVFGACFEAQSLSDFGRLGERHVFFSRALIAKEVGPISPIFGIVFVGSCWQLQVFFVALVVFISYFESQALSGLGRLGDSGVLLTGVFSAKEAIPIIPISGIELVGICWQLRILFVALLVFRLRFEFQALSGF